MSKAKKPKLFITVGDGKFTAKEIERFVRSLRFKKEWPVEPNEELRLAEFRQNLTDGFTQGMRDVIGDRLRNLLDYLHEEKITFREWQVIVLLRPFASDQDIADKLEISVRTVNIHMTALKQKLGLTREQLTMLCY